jgi:hypothetical protein
MGFFTFLALFLLPIFPFSLLTNRLLMLLRPKLFAFCMMICFVLGGLLLHFVDTNFEIIKFLALFTLVFYSFRLLGVRDLRSFILYLFSTIASLSWIWYFVGGDMLELIVTKGAVLALFLYLYGFLTKQYEIIHQKSIRGLGGAMPRWSILFVLSLFALSSSIFFLGYEFFEIEFASLPIFYGVVLIISWVLINWGSVKVIEWLVYTEKKEDVELVDLSSFQLTLSLSVLVIVVIFTIFYNTRGLV